MTNNNHNLLLEVKDLKTYFFLNEGTVRAVDGVSFTIERGKTLGVVGESGCGKSITARSILGMIRPPGRTIGGEIIYHQRVNSQGSQTELLDLTKLNAEQLQRIADGEDPLRVILTSSTESPGAA